jgi:hypothetical protein
VVLCLAGHDMVQLHVLRNMAEKFVFTKHVKFFDYIEVVTCTYKKSAAEFQTFRVLQSDQLEKLSVACSIFATFRNVSFNRTGTRYIIKNTHKMSTRC